jgi:hypothetical protein
LREEEEGEEEWGTREHHFEVKRLQLFYGEFKIKNADKVLYIKEEHNETTLPRYFRILRLSRRYALSNQTGKTWLPEAEVACIIGWRLDISLRSKATLGDSLFS